MSAFKNFVQDFPKRCTDILNLFGHEAEMKDREVTLLLSVATPSLIIPFERLHKANHPSNDLIRFKAASEQLNTELKKKCKDSCLWTNQTWQYKMLKELQGDPDAWGLDADAKSIIDKHTCTVLSILRNALAHGNIWTTGEPINTVVFVSLVSHEKPMGPFHCLQCSPLIFAKFLRNWIAFLSLLSIPGGTFVETSDFEEKST